MLGVGKETSKELERHGVYTIGHIARLDEKHLHDWLGKWGSLIWVYANGLDTSPVNIADIEIPAKSVSRGTTTIHDLEKPVEVWKVVLQLCQDIGESLRSYEKKAKTIQITVRNNKLEIKQWQCKLPSPTQSSSYIARQAFDLFQRSYKWEKPIRSLTVRTTDLVSLNTPYQLDFYSDIEKIEKSERLDACISDLRYRYGKDIIMPAILCGEELTKINETKLIMPTGMVGV